MLRWRDLLAWIESSALGHAIRESGVWTYGVINLLHILGIATLFGALLILDLRLLGWRRSVPLSNIVVTTVPLAVVGFCLAIASGICMLATNGTEYIGNPFLPIKFAAIALALVNALVTSRLAAWRQRDVGDARGGEQRLLQLCGGLSLLCWTVALGSGRMIGYW